MERTGADAVPIVVLINFLIGFVMAFQGAVQLKQFGANIYVADLVGLSITRELGPLMTAIIVCGRSGAAFAAELGTMKVSEEIDALRTMGFGPLRYLVLPRILALILVMPDPHAARRSRRHRSAGCVVGLVEPRPHRRRLPQRDAEGAARLGRLLGRHQERASSRSPSRSSPASKGFATTGGAEGVGRRTTSSVVVDALRAHPLDAGFTVLFHAFHL